MLKFFFESKNISNFINIQIVWFLHISLRNNYNNKFLWMSLKKNCSSFTSQKNVEQRKKKKKEANSDDQRWLQHTGVQEGGFVGRGTETRVQIPTWRRSRILAGGEEGGDRMHPSAVPNCHIFHSNECETYICSLRSPRVDGPDKEEILEISSRK